MSVGLSSRESLYHDFLLASVIGKDEVKTGTLVRNLCKGCPEAKFERSNSW